VQNARDPELAEDYIRIYFTALALEKAASAAEKDPEGSPEDLHLQAALELARALGKDKLSSIADRKVERGSNEQP